MIKKYIQSITSINSEVFKSANFSGTNCFIIGAQPKRFMIDAGSFPEIDPTFKPRLLSLM